MSRRAVPKANGTAVHSAEVSSISRRAAPKANGTAARSAEACT